MSNSIVEGLQLGWEDQLPQEQSVCVPLPCSFQELQQIVASMGASMEQAVITSAGRAQGRDVLLVRIPQPARAAELASREVREFDPAVGSDDCRLCGHELAQHELGVTCPR
ncbi:hypothetical protein ACTQ49_14750 [Luteococcus sp. Sow4_B9]|uniref:hypothetical protein n=1 Tax=Luteococcus sp. Sow4_B9 TaxID=3438792 RepID=UPI003F9B0B2C